MIKNKKDWYIERAKTKLEKYLKYQGLHYLQIDKVNLNCLNSDMYSSNPNTINLYCTIFLKYQNLLKDYVYGFGVGIQKETFDNLYFLCKEDKNNNENIHIIKEYKKLSYYLDNPNTGSELYISKIIECYIKNSETLLIIQNLDNLIQNYLQTI